MRGKTIRDPIYGYVELTDKEIKLIELPVFQRLRRISQLSLADLVYPNATHNRFSHNLGVMHLAKMAANHLKKSGLGEKIGLSDEDYELIVWAGLLHDIGHLPFSHVCEPVFAYFIDKSTDWKNYHVKIGCRMIENSDFGIKDVLGDDVRKICKLIKGELDGLSKHMVEIMTGPCSVDRLDYLKRDAHHAGTPEYAIIDAQRIITSLTVSEDDPYIAPVFKRKALYAVEGVLLSHFYMYRAVYYHHAVRAAYLMFQEILWDAFENYGLKDRLKDVFSHDFWIHFDDHNLLTILRETDREIVSQLDELFLHRKLPKEIRLIGKENRDRIYGFLNKITYREKIEKERDIADKLSGFGVKRIFLDSPMVIPYPRSLLAKEKIYIWDDDEEKHVDIADLSPYIRALEDAAEKQLAARVYVLPESLRDNEKFSEELNKVIMEELHRYV